MSDPSSSRASCSPPCTSRRPPPGLFGTDDPELVVVKAAAVSEALARVVRDRKLFARISGKEHVLVGGWTLLGSMLGVFPVTVWSRPLDDGWEARVEATDARRRVVGAAESECLRSERRWAKADDYAIRSMAQTRATSKALQDAARVRDGARRLRRDPGRRDPGRGRSSRRRADDRRLAVEDPAGASSRPASRRASSSRCSARWTRRSPDGDWAARCRRSSASTGR